MKIFKEPRHTIQPILNWLNRHSLFIASCFLLVFIPLYPKLPLFDIIPGYIVRVRIEDILVLGVCIWWIAHLLRGRIQWKTPYNLIVGLYAIAGAAAIVSGIFITKTIPLELLHVGKSILHYLRYLEYFSLLFIAATTAPRKHTAKIVVFVLALTLALVAIYGIGQKYLYWPVYSTMNREFSKGIRLYLTEHARVQSTFGGHYDLAAYLVVILPVILTAAFQTNHRVLKTGLWLCFTLGLWLLTVSASRSSFLAFIGAASISIILYSLTKKNILSKMKFIFANGLIFGILLTIMLSLFGQDIQQRMLQTLEGYPELNAWYHTTNAKRKLVAEQYLPDLSSFFASKPPAGALSTDDLAVMVASDQRPVTTKPSPSPMPTNRPSDVFFEVSEQVPVSTISASGAAQTIIVEKPPTYSEAALRHGLSSAIRLDTLWPRALQGFYRNPVFGSGYATLTKETITQFTEAESTDNNFLRTLGETGLFGFVTFYGTIVLTAMIAWRLAKVGIFSHQPTLETALGIGYICATLGLLVNAVYIDVFASSKVAFTYWSLAGVITAIWSHSNTSPAVLPKTKQPEQSMFKQSRTRKKNKSRRKS
ncbi:O-antigen ligase family protein [Candidatus Woesebacteria bacterium]|nr:O-antigen ligase family protein [Candidatus Woesebacteria bacterium]